MSYGGWQLACALCSLPLIKGLEGFLAGKRIAEHISLVGPISLLAPASPGLANWLREEAVPFAFSTYRANRLLFCKHGVQLPGRYRAGLQICPHLGHRRRPHQHLHPPSPSLHGHLIQPQVAAALRAAKR